MHQKTVLVTGASRGIGRAIALHFAKEGCHVFLNSHHSIEELKKVQAEIQETCHISVALVPGDVGNPDDVRQIFQTIESSVGGLDILVNNAAMIVRKNVVETSLIPHPVVRSRQLRGHFPTMR